MLNISDFDIDIKNKALWESEYNQIESPYYSTIAFEKFLNDRCCFCKNTEVLDIGTGIGANLYYFTKQNPEVQFLGLDYNRDKIKFGKQLLKHKGASGITLDYGDWFKLPTSFVDRFDGIFNVHTLCVFKHIEPAIEALTSLRSRWIAFNSLFYEGPLDVLIHIRDHNNPFIDDNNPDGDFNIFSLEHAAQVFLQEGYELKAFEPFYPPGGIPRKPGGNRGTYTIRTEFHERTQFSGPVYLPWYFILAIRK